MARPTPAFHRHGLVSIISSAVRAISDSDLNSQSCCLLSEICLRTWEVNWRLAKGREQIHNSRACKDARFFNGNSTSRQTYRRRSLLSALNTRDAEQS